MDLLDLPGFFHEGGGIIESISPDAYSETLLQWGPGLLIAGIWRSLMIWLKFDDLAEV